MDEEQTRKAFGRWLKRLRERDGRTAKRLSLDAGLEQSYVGKLESGAIKAPGDRTKWGPLARELRVPDAVMAAAVGGFFPDDAPQALLPPVTRPEPVIDPTLPPHVREALRPLVGKLPDDDVRAAGRILAAMKWKSREELEQQEGPSAYPPDAGAHDPRDEAHRDGTTG